MADMPFFGGAISSGGGTGGTTDYDALSNRPVTNLTGHPVVISELASGVYNIDGTWAMTADDTPRETMKDDMFYVYNGESGCRLTWITAGDIHTYRVSADGSAGDIEEDSVATTEDIVDSLVGSF